MKTKITIQRKSNKRTGIRATTLITAILSVCILLYPFASVFSQSVGINTTGTLPNASALLDVDAAPGNNKGLLIPRVSLTNVTVYAPITGTPTTSLIVYSNTAPTGGNGIGYYYWDGTQWAYLLNSSSFVNNNWTLSGNTLTGTLPATPNEWIGTINNADWIIKTNNTEKMRVQAGGFVGIGTNNPQRALHIQDNNGVVRIDRDINSAAVMCVRTAPGNFNTIWKTFTIGSYATGVNSGSFEIYDFGTAVSGAGTPRFTIDNVGNVGINTQTPNAKLQIGDATIDATNMLLFGETAANIETHLPRIHHYCPDAVQNGLAIGAASTNGGIHFFTGNVTGQTSLLGTGTNSEKMTILVSGEVGINTTAPAYQLEVSGQGNFHHPSSVNYGITVGGFSTGNPYRGMGSTSNLFGPTGTHSNFGGYAESSNSGVMALAVQDNNPYDGVYFVNGGGDFTTNTTYDNITMAVQASGNVGIGTVSPSQALHVVGNICYTGSIGACSDKRYKKDFQPLTHSLQNVLRMEGLTYYWEKEKYPEQKFTAEKQIGFIAQDVEKIYPELVTTDKEGYKSVDYSRLTPILVEAIKELAYKNAELTKEIEKIKNSLNLKAENK